MKRLILLLLLLSTNAHAGWCNNVYFSGYWENVPPNGGEVPLSSTNPYVPNSWAFNSVVPYGTYVYITDIVFQSKGVQPDQNGKIKSSYVVFTDLFTVAEHMGGQVHFITPIYVGGGFRFLGSFINQSTEPQNMIALIAGYAWDSLDPNCVKKY